MIITKELTCNQIVAYLNQTITLAQLVDWAENALGHEELEAQNAELLRDIIARLGLADMAEFGLSWADCAGFLTQLGYQAQVKAIPIAA